MGRDRTEHMQYDTHTRSTSLSWLVFKYIKKNNIPHWGAVMVFTIYVFVGLIRSTLVLLLIFPSGYFSDIIVVLAMKYENMFLLL